MRMVNSPQSELMINKVYLNYNFHDLRGGLKSLPYSIEHSIDSGPWYTGLRRSVLLHKDWLEPTLKIVAALLAIVAGIFALIKLLK
jgi:hypothetical protein